MKLVKSKKMYLIFAALTLGVAAFVFLIMNDGKNTATQKENLKPLVKPACELFKTDDAEKLLGLDPQQQASEAEPGNINTNKTNEKIPKPADRVESGTPEPAFKPMIGQNQPESQKSAVKVTSCSYTRKEGDPRNGLILINVRTSERDQSERDFEAVKGSNPQAIDGFGEKAYWRTGKDLAGNEFGQLMILKDSSVLAISAGAKDIELSKKIAEVVLGNF